MASVQSPRSANSMNSQNLRMFRYLNLRPFAPPPSSWEYDYVTWLIGIKVNLFLSPKCVLRGFLEQHCTCSRCWHPAIPVDALFVIIAWPPPVFISVPNVLDIGLSLASCLHQLAHLLLLLLSNIFYIDYVSTSLCLLPMNRLQSKVPSATAAMLRVQSPGDYQPLKQSLLSQLADPPLALPLPLLEWISPPTLEVPNQDQCKTSLTESSSHIEKEKFPKLVPPKTSLGRWESLHSSDCHGFQNPPGFMGRVCWVQVQIGLCRPSYPQHGLPGYPRRDPSHQWCASSSPPPHAHHHSQPTSHCQCQQQR